MMSKMIMITKAALTVTMMITIAKGSKHVLAGMMKMTRNMIKRTMMMIAIVAMRDVVSYQGMLKEKEE
jgi:hypothetical protein